MSCAAEQADVIRAAVAALDHMAIAYAIAGSVASSTYGVIRLTHDADLMVEPFPGREAEFARHFGDDFYLSLPAVEVANRKRSSFNLIHIPTGFKIDFFVRKETAFAKSVMSRRRLAAVEQFEGVKFFLASPEDVVLLKMEWYRLGGETSERQWSDIVGLLKVRRGKLDGAYLQQWAKDLQVSDLLARAMGDAGW